MHQKNESLPQDIMAVPKAKSCFQVKGMNESLQNKINTLLKENKLEETYSELLAKSNACLADGQMLIKLGHLCFRLGKYTDAEIWYYKALNEECEESLPSLWFGFGQLYYKVKNHIKCISSFLHLLSINPQFEYSSLVYLKIGVSYQLIKNYEQAVPYLEKSIEKEDLSLNLYSEVLCHLGISSLHSSDQVKAFQYFDQAACLCKNFRTATCLAWKLICTDPRKAVILCENMLKQCSEAESFDYRFFIAIALFRLKQMGKGLKILESIWDSSNNLLFGQYLVWAYFQKELYQNALTVLNKLISCWCFKTDLLISKYVVSIKIGRNNEAMEAYMKAFGILSIQGLSEGYISNTILTSLNQGIEEPKFSLADCPFKSCNDYISITGFR